MRFFLLMALLLPRSGYAQNYIWSMGSHRGVNEVSLSKEIIAKENVYVIRANQAGNEDSVRVVTDGTVEKILKDWQSLRYREIPSNKISICGDIFSLEVIKGNANKQMFYCNGKAPRDQKLKLKSFYEKLIKLSRGEIPFFE